MRVDLGGILDLVKMDLKSLNDLLGIGYKEHGKGGDGYDCFTLAQEVYRRHGMVLPDFDYTFSNEGKEDAVDSNRYQFVKIPSPEPLCIITFRYHPKYVSHVGVAIDHCRMIHAVRSSGVKIERYDSIWYKPKIEGFYRWTS